MKYVDLFLKDWYVNCINLYKYLNKNDISWILYLFILYSIYPLYNVYKTFWRRWWHPTLVLLPGISYGWRSLVGCSPWGHEESNTNEWLHFHFSLSCIGEGNGNPLQCSWLENLRDGGAWWAAVYGVTQSQTPLKWLTSSSSRRHWIMWFKCSDLYGI